MQIQTNTWVSFWLLIQWTQAYQIFQARIPNGNAVPDPCNANQIWIGVGHQNPLGGGNRNPFGLDFDAAGKKWTVDLCQNDSDGDGKTNGEELGDKNCVWKIGDVPSQYIGLSHPGICDPLGSVACSGKNEWVDCGIKMKLNCSVFHDPETLNFTAHLPKTEVPANETTYICMKFELPMDGDFHLVAIEPVIDNEYVVHHILVFGCSEGEISSVPVNQTYVCGMNAGGQCSEVIATWTVGAIGRCYPTLTGFRIGSKGYRHAALQIHWTNPERVTGLKDSSGLRLYYTPKLRPYDAGVLITGQLDLLIPPGEMKVTMTGMCPSACSREIMNDSIYITSAGNHMHYIGIYGSVEQIRDGKRTRYLTNGTFNYNSPTIHEYETAIEMRPGDELKTTCVYRSISRSKTAIFAEDTYQEMCLSFLIYYPKQNVKFPACLQWSSISTCELQKEIVQGCPYKAFFNATNPSPDAMKLFGLIKQNCVPDGTCRKECKEAVKQARIHPCLKGDISRRLRIESLKLTDPVAKVRVLEFYAALDSCDVELAMESYSDNRINSTCSKNIDGTVVCGGAQSTKFIFPFLFLSASIFFLHVKACM
ncbi:hypothetical protein CHS0354_025447 [Potamilus streckersoni]|uniref:Temptin n=1 Tax=Potamilus streckersoni TaxID=2493646 RepID=A0AAE0W8N6_9BIVA|nr:hypothetical protein CHS0354_025447 [Potamilus streckersoni]